MNNTPLLLAPTPQIKPLQAFLDEWILHYIEIDTDVTTRLSGEGSLYQAYLETCQQQRQVPVSRRLFTKRLEAFLEFHFGIPSTKTRDQKGIVFPAVKLKSTLIHTVNQSQTNTLQN